MKHLANLAILLIFNILYACGEEGEPLSECAVKCAQEPEVGPCNAAFPKYYYDPVEKKCKQFTWGGCGGSVPFQTLEECEGCGCH